MTAIHPTIPERFEILGQLGVGGSGIVRLAFDQKRSERVALKTLRHFSPSALARFKNEFRDAAELVHPNLVILYELFGEGRDWFISMEWIRGLDFLSYLALPDGSAFERVVALAASAEDDSTADLQLVAAVRNQPQSVFHSENTLWSALGQLVSGVRAIHRAGKLHRDIKPSNVRVEGSGRVVLLDFGLLQASRPDSTVVPAGTLLYVAPEVLNGGSPSEASDWYALGVMLYQTLTGQSPFVGQSADILRAKTRGDFALPSTLNTAVSVELDSLCVKLLDPDPEQRPTGDWLESTLGRADDSGPATRTQPEAFVGRESHLEACQRVIDEHYAGEGASLVVIQGEAGIGKTAILERLLEELDIRESTYVLRGRCFAREVVTFNAFDRTVDQLAAILDRAENDPRSELDSHQVQALARLFPVLAQRHEPAETEAVDHTTSFASRQRAFSALRGIFSALASRATVVIAI